MILGLGLGLGFGGQQTFGPSGIPMDWVVDWRGGDVGDIVTPPILEASEAGVPLGEWSVRNVGEDEPLSHTKIAADAFTLPFNYLVDGQLLNGSNGRALRFDLDQAVSDGGTIGDRHESVKIAIEPTINLGVFQFVFRSEINNTGQQINTDLIAFASGAFGTFQHVANGALRQCYAHSGGSNGLLINLANETDYLVTMLWDTTGLKLHALIQNATTLAVAGYSVATHTGDGGPLLFFEVTDYLYIDDAGGDIFVKILAANWTAPVFPARAVTVPAPTISSTSQTAVDTVTIGLGGVVQFLRIERQTGAGAWSVLHAAYDLHNSGPSLVDNTVSDATTYTYRATAVIGSYESPVATGDPVTIDNASMNPTWTQALDIESATTADASALESKSIRNTVVCATSGPCSRLRLGIKEFLDGGDSVKLALHNASTGALLGEASLTGVADQDDETYLEATFDPPVNVLAGNFFHLSFALSGTELRPGYSATGGGLEDFTNTFASGFPPDPSTEANNITSTCALGMGVIPNGQPQVWQLQNAAWWILSASSLQWIANGTAPNVQRVTNDGFSGNVTLAATVQHTAGTLGDYTQIAFIVRGSGLQPWGSGTGYLATIRFGAVDTGVMLYKTVAGADTLIAAVAIALATATEFRIALTAAGDALGIQVQRPNNDYLTSGGGWNATPQNAITETDEDIAGAGRAAFTCYSENPGNTFVVTNITLTAAP